MNCPYCGTQLNVATPFCPSCGANLSEYMLHEETQATPMAPATPAAPESPSPTSSESSVKKTSSGKKAGAGIVSGLLMICLLLGVKFAHEAYDNYQREQKAKDSATLALETKAQKQAKLDAAAEKAKESNAASSASSNAKASETSASSSASSSKTEKANAMTEKDLVGCWVNDEDGVYSLLYFKSDGTAIYYYQDNEATIVFPTSYELNGKTLNADELEKASRATSTPIQLSTPSNKQVQMTVGGESVTFARTELSKSDLNAINGIASDWTGSYAVGSAKYTIDKSGTWSCGRENGVWCYYEDNESAGYLLIDSTKQETSYVAQFDEKGQLSIVDVR